MLLSEVGYARPASVDEAVRLLAENDGARPLAGGQTIVNVMKARAAAPDVLVDLGALEDLRAIAKAADGGLELVPRAVQGDRPRARDCEQELLARLAAAGLREPRAEADHALLERVAAESRSDGDPRRGGVPVDLASLRGGLVGHVATHRLMQPRVWGGSRRGEP